MLGITMITTVAANLTPSHCSLNLMLWHVSEGHGFGTVFWLVGHEKDSSYLSAQVRGHFSGTSVGLLMVVGGQKVGVKFIS